MPSTRNQRVYLIRLALGDGVKNPLPLADFAALIKKRQKVSYDPSALSRMENGSRKVTVEDIETLAPLDPKQRGKAWLAGWDDDEGSGLINPATDRKLTDVELERAEAVVRASKTADGKKKPRRA